MADADDRMSGVPEVKKGRIPPRRDRDRILYSTEFRRLAGVTQVASATEKLLIHNRITHSTKVEQVAMGIVAAHNAHAEDAGDAGLGPLSPGAEWRAAAAGLGHDLGHPPFGHIGEEKLNSLLVCEEHRKSPSRSWRFSEGDRRKQAPDCQCKLPDGFEGNAQSFRIVTKLSVRGHGGDGAKTQYDSPYRQGLDLTRGTLGALSKYPWLRGDNPKKPRKWGAYDCDVAQLVWALDADTAVGDEAEFVPSVEAQVMDWADDITYAVHDIDDFFRLGIVPLDALRVVTGKEYADFMQYAVQNMDFDLDYRSDPDELKRFVANKFGLLPERPYLGLALDIASINVAVSEYIDLFIESTEIRNDQLKPSPYAQYLAEVLKQLTWYYVIDNPQLSTIQEGQKRLFEYVWDISNHAFLGDAVGHAQNKRIRRIPPMLKYFVQHALSETGCQEAYPTEGQRLLRGVIDFLASLTDVGAYKLYARLTGDADVSMLEPSIAY